MIGHKHRTIIKFTGRLFGLVLSVLLLLGAAACSAPRATQALMAVKVSADGQTRQIALQAGSTAQQALDAAGLQLGALDRLDPPAYTLLTDGSLLRVVRVTEEFSIEDESLPFERQTLQTESLADQESLLVQNGQNGLQETTYRTVYEDGVEVSRRAVKVSVVRQPLAEVVMVGVRAAHAPVEISGRLVYLLSNNAWVMEQSTATRRPLIISGDLDGRVFSLSDDGNWLLYTRRSSEKDQINSLWVVELASDPLKELDLKVPNVVHFAAWVPGSNSKVVFSTVEPRPAAPGWQANNDLYALSFSPSGWTSNWKAKPVLEANSGGVYGWWGMSFAWLPQGGRLAYARPDGVGVLDYADGLLTALMAISPLQTGGDWAWSPGLSWAPDGQTLYTVYHEAPETSQNFSLAAIPLGGGSPVQIAPQVGMFAYPVASPLQSVEGGQTTFQVAYLQALFPTQSESSRYQLMLMDRDGSNPRLLFPPGGESGLEPQRVNWSPGAAPGGGGYQIAVLYRGDLWLVDAASGEARQVTGDGLISRLDWK